MEHDVVPLGERHAPHNFEYADETARLAATITDSKWVNALALQLDDGSYWRVASVSPATWEPVVTPAWADLTGKPSTFPPSTHSHAISDVTDLQDELDAKQATLVNQANIKSINGVSLLGSGDITVGGGSGSSAWADITGKPTTLTGYGITDAEPSITKSIGYAKWTGSAWSFANENYMQTSHAANAITGGEIANWNTAFGWGNHATAGYQAALGYTPENAANKSTNATTDAVSNTKYPSVKAIVDYAVAADASVLSSAATDATTKANAAQAAAIAASTPVSHLGSGGAAHANVVAAGAAGFMSGADKTKLDAITGANSGDETGARIATLHHAASAKTTLVDADELTGQDSAAGFGLIRVTWANIKATLATWIAGGTIAGSFTTLAASGNTTLGDASTDTLNVGNGGIIKDASGNVGIGGAAGGDSSFQLSTNLTGATTAYGFRNLQTVQSGVTDNAFAYMSTPSTAAVAFTLLNLRHFSAYQGAIGAGSSITNQIGFFVDGSLTGATANYGFYSNIAASGATRYNFYAGGNAPNRFVGETLVIGPAGLGYGTGAGGTVTQATSRTTGVTLSKPTGKITLFSTTRTAGTFASFTLTNTLIAATDVVIVNFASATSADKYSLCVTAVAAGSCRIQVHNIAAVAVAEAPVINFCVLKGEVA